MSASELAIYDHVAVAVFVVEQDEAGVPRYSYANTEAQRAVGLSLDQLVGQTAHDVYLGRGGNLAYQRHLKAFETGKQTQYVLEANLLDKAQIVRTTLAPVRDESGKVVRLVGTAIEVGTNRMQEVFSDQSMVGPSEVEQFIAMAAHDLRTPMRNVQILAEMLRDGFTDHGDGKLDLIDLLDDVSNKSNQLITEVLEHAQTTSAKPDPTPFDFAELCRKTAKILDPQSQHSFSFSECEVRTDRTAVQIVLRNLLDNSLKYGGKEHLHIDVCARAYGSDTIEITVSDDGVGFENPGRAFLDTGEFRTGSGYGLLGVRRLINARGGAIHVEHPKTGSLVRFSMRGTVETPQNSLSSDLCGKVINAYPRQSGTQS